MGQYYLVCNLDKREYLHPHKFGDGLKLMEFGCSGNGTMTALAVLLANSNGRGRGDLASQKRVVGSWAGDRIVIAGDYAERHDKGELNVRGVLPLFQRCQEGEFRDISLKVMVAMMDEEYIAKAIMGQTTYRGSPFEQTRGRALRIRERSKK